MDYYETSAKERDSVLDMTRSLVELVIPLPSKQVELKADSGPESKKSMTGRY